VRACRHGLAGAMDINPIVFRGLRSCEREACTAPGGKFVSPRAET
jgi:hypothetical protein